MIQYIIQNPINGERQCVPDITGYEGWPILATLADGEALPEFHDVVNGQVVPILADFQTQKWEDTKALRATKANSTCSTPSGVVQIDEVSKQNINGLVTMAQIAQASQQPFSIGFTLADNSVATLDAPGMINLGVAVGQHINALWDYSRTLKGQIYAATDMATLNAIDITAGWPS